MRSSKNMRLMDTDIKRLQKSLKQKVDKEVQGLIQLIDLPDFDVSEFFQTLMRSSKYQQVLTKIPKQKQIDFFSRNFVTFIETQDQLSQMKLPELEQIPKAKIFKFEDLQEKKQQTNGDESSVVEIVDSFAAVTLQQNTSEIIRILQIINEMKQHSRYKNYFQIFSINQLYRESYQTFIESCEDKQLLLSMGEMSVVLKKQLKQKMAGFIVKVRTDMNIDSSVRGVKKIMDRLVSFIETTLKQCRQEFPSEKMANPIEGDIIIPKFLADLSKQFYQTIQPCIYEKQQLSQILQALQVVLQSSTELQSKGVNLSRDFKQLISHDLPLHMNKIIEVVIEAFDDILKQDNSLYELKYFQCLTELGSQMHTLKPINKGQYGKKCCSKKGILLINAFIMILEPLCDDKWTFLQDNVLRQLLDKVSGSFEASWHFWDYYQLFYFFDRLKSGKVNHKKLFSGEQLPANLKMRIQTAQKLSYQCWQIFQNRITNNLWTQILCKIPKNLWEIQSYLQSKGEPQKRPTIFGIEILFKLEEFIKEIQFRLQKQQFQFLITRFFQYTLYIIEYVLYYDYHSKGTKDKVFSLFKRSQKIYKRAKNFSIEEIDTIKENKKILTISRFTQVGVMNLSLDLYYLTEGLKIMTDYQKLAADPYVQKISQIEAKQHKTEPIDVNKQKFATLVTGCIKVYREQPQKIRQYAQKKRKQLSKQ